ncbi:hypothetical protein BD311DRAFT_755207 [Dichomitus squalens]|uniref:Uncharacterized protein n=1 Tax=Dichomitus squalens TaxID=114155 RepID=A0A4Q9MUG5_9APHY|nr:hypothetical protein BD311DRAFT_755207 [Dichomitus squalens]
MSLSCSAISATENDNYCLSLNLVHVPYIPSRRLQEERHRTLGARRPGVEHVGGRCLKVKDVDCLSVGMWKAAFGCKWHFVAWAQWLLSTE